MIGELIDKPPWLWPFTERLPAGANRWEPLDMKKRVAYDFAS